jgi:hypothetical protein
VNARAGAEIDDMIGGKNCVLVMFDNDNRIAEIAQPSQSVEKPRNVANLLGTKDNGRWSIEPADPGAKMTRNYRGHLLILETTIETTDGVAVVTDLMPTRMRGSHLPGS